MPRKKSAKPGPFYAISEKIVALLIKFGIIKSDYTGIVTISMVFTQGGIRDAKVSTEQTLT